MEITPKLRRIISERLERRPDGDVWHGEKLNGMPVLKYRGEVYPVAAILHHMGTKFNDMTKYKEQHEDMEQFEPAGDNPDAGDGTGESQ